MVIKSSVSSSNVENDVSQEHVTACQDLEQPAKANCPNMQIDLGDLALPPPPDGGWGWFIVLGSFLCMVFIDGVCFSYGIFLAELEETFGASKTLMTLAGSLLTGCYFIMGPLVSGLMNSINPRLLIVVGTLIASVCIFASSFAQNVYLFIGLFGVCGGIGFGLVYLPAATMVTTWFLQKRATTTGIIMAGSGVGATVYSFLIPHLIEKYTWRGSVMMIAAINLNSIVAAALFRSLRSEHSRQQRQLVKKMKAESRGDDYGKCEGCSNRAAETLTTIEEQDSLERIHREAGSGNVCDDRLPPKIPYGRSENSYDEIIITQTNQLVPVRKQSKLEDRVDLMVTNASVERVPVISLEAINVIVDGVLKKKLSQEPFGSTFSNVLASNAASGQVGVGSSICASRHFLASTHELNGQCLTVQPSDTAIIFSKPDLATGGTSFFASTISLSAGPQSMLFTNGVLCEAIVKELHKEIDRPVHRKDLFLSGSLIHLDGIVPQDDRDNYIHAVTRPGVEDKVRNPVMAMLHSLFDVSIFKRHTFSLLTLSSIFTMIGYLIPYQFLKDNAQTYGYKEQESAYLIAYLGIANTVGRLVAGWLSDQPWINVIYLNNFALIFSGVITMSVPAMNNYPALVVYAVAYGFVIASYVAVRTVLIVSVLGLDRLTNAFGFMLLFQGFITILATPLLGMFYDKYQNFGITFMFGGLAIVISGLLCLPLGSMSRWERNRGQKEAMKPAASTEVSVHSIGRLSSPARLLSRVRDLINRRQREGDAV